MKLIGFDSIGAVVRLSPADCAAIARFCEIAAESDELDDAEHQAEAERAESLGTLFRALAVGICAGGYVRESERDCLIEELAGLGLPDVIIPYPTPGWPRGKADQATGPA